MCCTWLDNLPRLWRAQSKHPAYFTQFRSQMQAMGIEWAKEVPTLEIEPIDPAFREVWNRVNGGGHSVPSFVSFPESPAEPTPEPKSSPEPEPLSRLLSAERQRRQAYQALGLSGPAEDCLKRIRLLTIASFFCFDPPPREAAPLPRLTFPSWCEGVRRLWRLEDAARQDFSALAQNSEGDPLRQALEQCARLCETTCRRLWNMMLNCVPN